MTTDGIRRKPIARGADTKSAALKTTPAPAAATTTPETAGGATAKRALDALDDVKGTATGSKGKQGVHTALAGLAAVEPKAKKWNWRAAVTGALLGLTLLTGASPVYAGQLSAVRPQQHTLVEKSSTYNAVSLRVAAGAGPPDTKPAYELTGEQLAGAKPVILLSEDMVLTVAHAVESERTTTPATTSAMTTATTATTATTVEVAPVVRVRGGLPETLATLVSGMTVVHGSDPGDFYCEHAFFTTTAVALQQGSSILRNSDGEVLTGFLHVPSDAFTYTTSNSESKVQAERHAERRDIVGAAIRGFYEDARTQIDNNVDGGAFRMLLTGYLQWGSVVDNPTGDFTGHTENVDAAMHRAFGADLLNAQGRVVDTRSNAAGMNSTTLEYQVKDAKAPNGIRTVLIQAAQLPVTDDAINGGDASLQRLIERGKPHAVMSMGVAGGGAYQVEFHADDGGLRVDELTGAITHDDGKSPARNHPDNYALGRAIHRGHELNGARPLVFATSTVVGGGD